MGGFGKASVNRISWFLSCVALAASSASIACAPGLGAPFDDAFLGAERILIVRVESVTLKPMSLDPTIVPYAEASTRVVQVLKGDPAEALVVEFLADSCGGVRLDVGRYYLAVQEDQADRLVLTGDDERIFTLEGEFSEIFPEKSPLIDAVALFVASAVLPDAKLVWDYYGRTRWPLAPRRAVE